MGKAFRIEAENPRSRCRAPEGADGAGVVPEAVMRAPHRFAMRVEISYPAMTPFKNVAPFAPTAARRQGRAAMVGAPGW
jgi:hypothetical protein